MRSVISLMVLLTLALTTGCISSQLPTLHDIITPNRPSVVIVNAPNTSAPSVTGTVVSEDGYILTSLQTASAIETLHVIAEGMVVYEGKLVGSDPRWDLALIKIKPIQPLRPVHFGDSDKIAVGDQVVLLGNTYMFALSDGNVSASAGMVSALHRILSVQMPGAEPVDYSDVFQYDAPSSGYSVGGPLFDEQGKAIGVAVRTSNTPENSGIGYGLSFALPSNHVMRILDRLKAGETVRHGLLGVQTRNITPEEYKAAGRSGVMVLTVIENSPAERIGLQVGDLLIGADGKAISNGLRLRNVLGPLPADQTVHVTYQRGKLVRTGEAVLMARPVPAPVPTPSPGVDPPKDDEAIAP